MSTILEAIWDRRDVRVDDWPLMSSPLPTLLLCSAYFYIVKIWGPQFMRDRKPYELRNTLIAYNLVQVRIYTHFADTQISAGSVACAWAFLNYLPKKLRLKLRQGLC